MRPAPGELLHSLGMWPTWAFGISLAINVVFAAKMFFPAGPPNPQLTIQADSTGLPVYVDKQRQRDPTDATFVVEAGVHTYSVRDHRANVICGRADTLDPGERKCVRCTQRQFTRCAR